MALSDLIRRTDGAWRSARTSCSAIALTCVALAAGCDQAVVADPGLPDSVYVQVLARLQVIPAPADSTGTAEADSLRAAVLDEYGVDSEQLLAFAEVVGRQPGRSEALWEAIGAAADSIREADGLGPEYPGVDDAAQMDGDAADEVDETDAVAGVPDSGAARPATAETPQRVPRERRGRPVAGQPVREP